MMGAQKVRFVQDPRDQFYNVVKEKVNRYFKENHLSRHCTPAMTIKVIFIFLVLACAYALILSNRLTALQMLPFACLIPLCSTMLIYNVAHDAVHNTFSRHRWVNNWLFTLSFGLIGDNGNLWKLRHVQSHHNYVNMPDLDVDIEVISLLRFSDKWELKKYHRYQHIYAPFIYLFYSLYWVTVSDFKYLFKDRIMNIVKVRNPGKEFRIWIVAKIFYYGSFIVIPMLVLSIPWWQVLLGFFIAHAVNSAFILIALLCTHLFDKASFTWPDSNGKVTQQGWAVHQVENCQDFSTTNRFITGLLGGENTHTAHHLFPRVAHAHYIPITKIIKETALEYGVQYHETTLIEGLRSHFRMLKKFGTEPQKKLAIVKENQTMWKFESRTSGMGI
jgi:linoleoyl-CoA desaturase